MSTGKRLCRGKKRRIALFWFLGEFVDELFDVLSVVLKGGAAGVGDGEEGVGFFTDKFFFDLDVLVGF